MSITYLGKPAPLALGSVLAGTMDGVLKDGNTIVLRQIRLDPPAR